MSQKRMGPAPFASFEDLSDEVRHGVGAEPPPQPACSESPPSAQPRLADIRERREPSVAVAVAVCLAPGAPRIDISRASSSSHHEEEEDNSRDSTPERELFEPQCARLGLAFREDGAMDLRSSTEELDFQDRAEREEAAAASARARAPPAGARKDSQGSELAFLCVSGRTSRLSSIGSQGSRASNQSRLSAASGASGRSPSPHKMLVETSFCGDKASAASAAAQPPLEQALLSRRHDPAEAVLAEGISIELRRKVQPRQQHAGVEPTVVVTAPEGELHNSSPPPPASPGRTIVSESGTEFTFIPLKGPLPAALKPATVKKPTTTAANSPQYIRIKLKPDHMYAAAAAAAATATATDGRQSEPRKPVTLNLNNGTSPKPVHVHAHSRTPSPSASRKSSFASLFRSKEAAAAAAAVCSPAGSVFGHIFGGKPKQPKSCIKKQQQQPELRSPLPNLEFSFNGRPRPRLKYYETPLEGDSIRIPLHSPGAEPEPEPEPRHGSTSSETMVFSTNLGSNNEIFTTKLPAKETAAAVTTPPPRPQGSVRARSGSSESERESASCEPAEDDEHELKTLVFQQDSFEQEDELPYVPTTLPLERSVGVPIVPVKQRGEIRMCPIERPRSTTPINPSCLEDYCEDGAAPAEPKLRISLPGGGPARGPRAARWADFAETGMGGGAPSSPPPPPLPPRGAPRDWINFEEVPERRKPPKRIQTIPTGGGGGGAARQTAEETVVYSYVNPEDCKCECHELAAAHAHPATPDAFPDRRRPPS